ncbi:MAG: HNH endonuclease [Proteobacteria bacterium]|jgi:5-methylcytosine-specific restriction endonuclease McrA|nr:HNH endonuclease [Pseudomonadota bacterium]MDA1300170.1 HNH endonuclease [Pseudomonadota bacterium]
MSLSILRINTAGFPLEWISWQEAVCLHAREMVSWTYGEEVMSVHGGNSRLTGERTVVTLNSIMACRGKVYTDGRAEPPLTNRALFRRDQNICLYCGNCFNESQLSRDHVQPISRGGHDVWTNVVTACKRCNARKGNLLLDECSLELLALPYCPNHAEYLALSHSGRILGDQMAFLRKQFSANSRLLAEQLSPVIAV